MLPVETDEVRFALLAVQQASLLVRQIQTELVLSAQIKDDHSPVTIADYASQALFAGLLSEAFPADCLVAEEDATKLRAASQVELRQQVAHYVSRVLPQATPGQVCDWIDRGAAEPGERFWTLDPIDGTKGFLRGDQYAVALALVDGAQVQVAALGCPNLSDGYRPQHSGPGSLVLAVRGRGCWTTSLQTPGEFTPLRVSRRRSAARGRLLRSFEGGHTDPGKINALMERLGMHGGSIAMDSQAKYAVLAAGQAELMLRLLSPSRPDYREKIWDQAAGSLIVTEAGGMVTDLDGKALDFSAGRTLSGNRGVLASNGKLHQTALRALRELGA